MAKVKRTWVEWVNLAKAERIFKSRRAKAIARGSAVSPEAEDSFWDWLEMDEALETRTFPNIGMAKGWAARWNKLDGYEMPRVYQEEFDEERPWDAETVVELEYQGFGAWMDLKTGDLTPPAPARSNDHG